MIKFIKENSPRPAATGRSEDTKYQLNYNTIPTECKDFFIEGIGKVPLVANVESKKCGIVPLADVPMMSDYKWQLLCLKDRMEHPEKYDKTENVAETIANIKKWLSENAEKTLQKVNL